MPVVAVMYVGQTGETCRQAVANCRLADVAAAPGLGAARHLEHHVVGQEGHDAVEVVGVERVDQCLQRGKACRHVGLLQS